MTDADGRVAVSGVGVYHFTISPGCAGQLLVTTGARGEAGVVDGQASSGELRIDWQRRYIPNAPMFSDPLPPWPIGKDIVVLYSLTDRCSNSFASNVSFAPLVFTTSTNMRIVKPPTMRADNMHRATVVVECLRVGDVALLATDKLNPNDKFDLIQDAATYARPRCG